MKTQPTRLVWHASVTQTPPAAFFRASWTLSFRTWSHFWPARCRYRGPRGRYSNHAALKRRPPSQRDARDKMANGPAQFPPFRRGIALAEEFNYTPSGRTKELPPPPANLPRLASIMRANIKTQLRNVAAWMRTRRWRAQRAHICLFLPLARLCISRYMRRASPSRQTLLKRAGRPPAG